MYGTLLPTQVEKYPNGNFVGPTVINNMTTDMDAYKQEIFGPVLCVINVDTLDDAIELINRQISGILKRIKAAPRRNQAPDSVAQNVQLYSVHLPFISFFFILLVAVRRLPLLVVDVGGGGAGAQYDVRP